MAAFRIPRRDTAARPLDWRSGVSLTASMAFVAAMSGLASHPLNESIVVYALSFWPYWVYALAFVFRSTPLSVFKRDAVFTRTVSLIAFASVYFSQPLSTMSLVVVGLGFLLNAAAVNALGVDRTYYGYELDELPPQRIIAFPYSWIPHPMLVGNMAAFGGALLNDAFRRDWWPLAVAHVFFNFGIILMEAYASPHRPMRRVPGEPAAEAADILLRSLLWSIAGGLAAAASSQALGRTEWEASAAFAGACCAAYATVLFESYSSPRARRPRTPAFNMSRLSGPA